MSYRRLDRSPNRCRMIAVLVPLLWSVSAAIVGAQVEQGILNIHATFSGDPSREVTVSWRTETPLEAPVVRYRPADPSEADWATVRKAETVESAGGFNHHVRLGDLEPDRRYAYRVSGPDGALGPRCTFRTAPEGREDFTFAVVGDVQGDERPSATWQTLGRWIAERDVAFMLLLGDLVQTGGNQAQWNVFFNSAHPDSDRSLFHSTVIMPLPGNHDHHITAEQKEAGDLQAGVQRYLDQFRLPPNENETLNGRNYTFTYGNARLVILDTSGRGPDGSTHVEQTRWLASLNLEDRPWGLAAHHVPVLRFLNHVPSTSARNVWRPHFYRHYMDMVFNGHNHSHAVSWPFGAVDLDGWDGGRGFAGPWQAREDVDSESGMDSLFLLEENDAVRYEGYQTAGRAVRTMALGTHQSHTHESHVIDARRSLKPIDTTRTRELWMGYAYKKLGKYYGGGGWELIESSREDRFIRVGTTRVMEDGRYGYFQVNLARESAVSRRPIIEEGKIPETPFFVLVKFAFEPDHAVARLKAYRAPEPLPHEEPEDWDLVVEADGEWALRFDTLVHGGSPPNRLEVLDEFRLGERMTDVLLVPEGGAAEGTPLVEERFESAPTIDREHGVVYYDGGGVNSSGPARDEWFVRFRENAPRMPLVGLVTVTQKNLRVRTCFYDDFEEYKAGDVFNEFQLRQPE